MPEEHVVFSCRLEGTPRVVSLCVSKAADARRYVAGRLGAPDTLFAGPIQRTTLGYAGGTGGYAYSFEDDGRSHVLYAISGDSGLARSGEMLTDPSLRTAMSDRACDPGSLIENEDVAILRELRAWGPNEHLETNGLPTRGR